MSTVIVAVIVSLAGLALGIIAFVLTRGVRAYFRARGKRLVTCPETVCTVAVELDAKGAAFKAVTGQTHLCLKNCSRWPERQDCDQDCLKQVEAFGDGCLVRNIVARWYKGKTCVYCRKPVDSAAEWTGHMPALQDPELHTTCWAEIPAEKLPEVFQTYQPVCWSCHMTETFRREHPELITERPARW